MQPAAGDAGTALGAALWIDATADARRPGAPRLRAWTHAYLGPAYSTTTRSRQFLRWSKLPYRRLDDVRARRRPAAGRRTRSIGWFQGRMEFGPRALGARSILASPIHPEMQARLNEIKDREDFRPVAPAVPARRRRPSGSPARRTAASRRSCCSSTTCGPRRPTASRRPATSTARRASRPSTARQNPLFYDLLQAFGARTGVPVLVNTSFNTRGEPIVCTPRDAVEAFWTSPLDALVIGSFVLEKHP